MKGLDGNPFKRSFSEGAQLLDNTYILVLAKQLFPDSELWLAQKSGTIRKTHIGTERNTQSY